MRPTRLLWPLVALAILVAVLRVHAALPSPRGPINDFAGILDASATSELTKLVDDARENTTAEIAVVTVSSLDGMTVEEYANKLFAAWGIGKKGKDNGVLVLVAPTERKVRIEVGYGLEPVLPDGLAGEIIRTDFLPRFKSGEYAGGIMQGTRHIVDTVQRNHALSPAERSALTAAKRPSMVAPTVFLLVVATSGLWLFGLGLRTKTLISAMLGGLTGGGAVIASLFPAVYALPWVVVPPGILMFVFGWRDGRSKYWIANLRGTPKHGAAASTGWMIGSASGSRSRRGGSSGSGHSSSGGSSSGG